MKRCAALFLLCLILLGCAREPAPTEPTETVPVSTAPTEPSTVPTTVPETTEPAPAFFHPLTGEPMDAPYDNSRPYMVMINNIRVAQPQCGTSRADMMFEILVEGGITRMMALFTTPQGDTPIGSIRSLRPYYLSLARGYDAIVVHAGGSQQAYGDLYTTGWDHLDGVSGANSGAYYYRVQERIDNAGYEHSMFLNMEDAVAYAIERECRLEHEDFEYALVFDDAPLTTGSPAAQVTVSFRGSKQTLFDYDPQTGLYTGSQYDEIWADGNDGTPQTFRNLIVLQADAWTVDDYGRLAMDLTGKGDGLLIRDGHCIPIVWSRETESDPFYYSLADGSPAALGVGRSYVAITPTMEDTELQP